MAAGTPFGDYLDDYLEELASRDSNAPDATSVGMIVHVLAFVFVATHAELRRRYMPSVPKDSLDQDLVAWTVHHMKYFFEQLPLDDFHLTPHQLEAIETTLQRHARHIEKLLQTPPEDWPLLHSH